MKSKDLGTDFTAQHIEATKLLRLAARVQNDAFFGSPAVPETYTTKTGIPIGIPVHDFYVISAMVTA